MAEKEDAEFSKSLAEYENLEKQLEVVLIQKNQLSLQIAEAKNALDELKDAQGEIYRSVGSLIMKTTKEDAEKKLKEKVELMEVRYKAISKEEERLKDAVLKLQKVLKEKMEQYEKKS